MYHNIESLKPLSMARTFPYVGYAADGTKYHATRQHSGRGWRFAMTISREGYPPYFYARTLREASEKLATIGSN